MVLIGVMKVKLVRIIGGTLSEDYALCGKGKSQSPIDITKTGNIVVDSGGIKFHYKNTPLAIINNGHTIQINYKFDSFIKMGAKTYKLLQFHFHSPSENKVDGNHYDMEAHFVHKNDDGQLAVVGVFIKEGKSNPLLEILWDNIPSEINKEKVVAEISVNASDLLPND